MHSVFLENFALIGPRGEEATRPHSSDHLESNGSWRRGKLLVRYFAVKKRVGGQE